METKFYTISKFIIMEVKIGRIFEYYIRESVDRFDYFRFSFGSDAHLTQQDLEKLDENGYFEGEEA